MIKKDLVILGSYPSSEKSKEVLKQCIKSLKEHFDIMLCTHYPADFEIQNMVNYYIYDYRNEMVVNEEIYIYGDSDSFYFQGYIEGSSSHPGFAIYRSIMNGVRFARDYYDKFYYIESDAIFSLEDVQKILDIKKQVNEDNKKGWFFKLDKVLTSNIFYCDVNFFLDNFPQCKNVNEYNQVCHQVNSFGLLENFLYSVLEYYKKLDQFLLIKDVHFTEYFKDSKMSLTSYREDGMNYPFELRLVKVENTDKIAFVYVNNNINDSNEYINFSINDIISTKLPLSKTYMSQIIDSNSDTFTMTIGNYIKKYTREGIFASKSFVRFK
jgi:hypothetical protein